VKRPLALIVVAVGAACTLPVTPPPEDSPLSAPVNSCPTEHPCSNYSQTSSGLTPQCNGGVCLVVATLSNVVLAVSLSEDSYFAPGQTFAMNLGDLLNTSGTDKCALTGTPTEPRPCTHLPAYGIVDGAYLASPDVQQTLHWNLGNPGKTALPVHVSYRPLWTPPGSSTPVDADSLGLPLEPLAAFVTVDNSLNRAPGPNGGESINFYAEVQPALYERVVAPDPPFDAAFPPDVSRVTVAAGLLDDLDQVAYDATQLEGAPTIPTFDLSRVEGLTGWTAYLRDTVTKRTLSPVAPLSGPKTTVVLPTNHHPSDGDALTGAELVVAPPAGQPIPTGVFAPQAHQFSRQETYPSLPATVAVSGSVTGADGVTPVAADLVFDATGIYTAGSPPILYSDNFEYRAWASARMDPHSGASVYTVALPPGQYTVTASPLASGQSVTVVQLFQVDPPGAATDADGGTGSDGGDGGTGSGRGITLSAQQPVLGEAVLSDKRPLSGATVEAIPSQCAVGQSDVCLPRFAETVTAADGSFALMLDQGGYTLRIAPPDGTGFGWFVQTVLVGPAPVYLPKYTVDVPARASLVLHDSLDNAIVGAVVRVYQIPSKGPALELGRAITDSSGFYEMYLTPRTQ
jgi:hypothetical protein